MRKALFYGLSAVLWGACLGLVILVWLEYLGGYDQLKGIGKAKKDKFELYQSTYYGKPLDSDPYQPSSIQHLHPFYMFSLPWTQEGITELNGPIISLNTRGFRNSFSNGAPEKGVVLGGSTVFGSQASSDETTLVSALNRVQSGYDFQNYGAPSWNSHQEMVAYTKIPFDTAYVIAFSGANDFSVAIHYCRSGYDFPLGSPESFEYLAAITDDVRGERKDGGFFSGLFPRTQEKIAKLVAKLRGSKKVEPPDCRDRILAAADAFLANQSVVRDIAVARGGQYLLVLQPHLHFLREPEGRRREMQAELRAVFYRYVAESKLCRTTPCLDLTHMFEGYDPLHVDDTRDSPHDAIFVDGVHLTDRGYAIVAELLSAEIGR